MPKDEDKGSKIGKAVDALGFVTIDTIEKIIEIFEKRINCFSSISKLHLKIVLGCMISHVKGIEISVGKKDEKEQIQDHSVEARKLGENILQKIKREFPKANKIELDDISVTGPIGILDINIIKPCGE